MSSYSLLPSLPSPPSFLFLPSPFSPPLPFIPFPPSSSLPSLLPPLLLLSLLEVGSSLMSPLPHFNLLPYMSTLSTHLTIVLSRVDRASLWKVMITLVGGRALTAYWTGRHLRGRGGAMGDEALKGTIPSTQHPTPRGVTQQPHTPIPLL